MLVLALDTTTRGGSCALARDGVVVREQAGDAARDQAQRLPSDLMVLLDAERVALPEVDVFAVSTGPGSFTGLRVGIATMQGLAFAASRPLVGVSAFDALASLAAGYGAGEPRHVATWVDAWRGEVFAAAYDGLREVAPPRVAAPGDLLAESRGPLWFIGDGAHTFRDLILQTLGDRASIAEPASPLLAGAVARLATARASAGELPPPHAIRPLYVRRSDAELARSAEDVHDR